MNAPPPFCPCKYLNHRAFLIFFFLVLFPFLIFPQSDLGFTRNLALEVFDNNDNVFSHAWAGGMNSVRFSEIDINCDGQKDLFVFEKNGNRILPFIRLDNNSLRYAPEYARHFPKLHDWAILVDYDGDGKEDIFTYGLAGITVYRNASEESLAFELVTEQLLSNYYGNLTNIYAAPDDYLAVIDIDGDGDLDVLNFWALGMYVHLQKNWAMENYGRRDTFDFRLEDECWGQFHEGEENNEITLFSDCGGGSKHTRHIGSSMYALDYNEDGLIDLVLGDVDYPGLLLLTNGGTTSNALMTKQNPNFPNDHTPVRLYSMPAINFIDVDLDGKPELVASPSDPSLKKSENINSVWLYEHNSLTDNYELTTTSFLQDEMIDVGSGAVPVLFDWDNDGLLDLFIGNFGRYDSSQLVNGFLNSYYSSSITYCQNVGTATQPRFRLVTEDFGNLRQYGFTSLLPAFADLDGDGAVDMLCGTEDGSLILFANTGTQTAPSFGNPIRNYAGINVKFNSAPQLFDLDGDGLLDLIIGNRRGHIVYYHNGGTSANPQFVKVADTLGMVDVRDFNISYFGYSTPHFFKNSDDETMLFCGNEKGTIFYYASIDGNLEGQFELVQEAMYELEGNVRYTIREGSHSAVCVGDLNNDGLPDLIVGNWAGGLAYFEGAAHPDSTVALRPEIQQPQFSIYPNPCSDYFYIDLHGADNDEVQLTLFDLRGRVLLSKPLSRQTTVVPVAHLPNGVYIGRLDGRGDFKLVVVRGEK